MIRSLIAALALSALSIPHVEATVRPLSADDSIRIGVPAPLALAIEDAGVPVYDGRDLPQICQREGYTVYAAYSPVADAIIMCPNAIPNAEMYVESFTHEAVHLVQDCRAGLRNEEMYVGDEDYVISVAKALPEHKFTNIIRSYSEEDYIYEIEAFYFETKPLAVAEGVQNFCF
jgi:hypothetical protein